jgi:hypothetical protein
MSVGGGGGEAGDIYSRALDGHYSRGEGGGGGRGAVRRRCRCQDTALLPGA